MINFRTLRKYQSGGSLVDTNAMRDDLKEDSYYYRNNRFTRMGKKRLAAIQQIENAQDEGYTYDIDEKSNTFEILDTEGNVVRAGTGDNEGLALGESKFSLFNPSKAARKEVSRALYDSSEYRTTSDDKELTKNEIIAQELRNTAESTMLKKAYEELGGDIPMIQAAMAKFKLFDTQEGWNKKITNLNLSSSDDSTNKTDQTATDNENNNNQEFNPPNVVEGLKEEKDENENNPPPPPKNSKILSEIKVDPLMSELTIEEKNEKIEKAKTIPIDDLLNSIYIKPPAGPGTGYDENMQKMLSDVKKGNESFWNWIFIDKFDDIEDFKNKEGGASFDKLVYIKKHLDAGKPFFTGKRTAHKGSKKSNEQKDANLLKEINDMLGAMKYFVSMDDYMPEKYFRKTNPGGRGATDVKFRESEKANFGYRSSDASFYNYAKLTAEKYAQRAKDKNNPAYFQNFKNLILSLDLPEASQKSLEYLKNRKFRTTGVKPNFKGYNQITTYSPEYLDKDSADYYQGGIPYYTGPKGATPVTNVEFRKKGGLLYKKK